MRRLPVPMFTVSCVFLLGVESLLLVHMIDELLDQDEIVQVDQRTIEVPFVTV